MSSQKFNTPALVAALEEYASRDDSEHVNQLAMLSFVEQHSDFYRRSLLIGHVTASAWVVDINHEQVLLTHHARLDRWMQLGGHIEDDHDIQSAALREASEESGLTSIRLADDRVFDIDIHPIPETAKAPAHRHYDIRFLMYADPTEQLSISSESHSLAWVALGEVSKLTVELSVLRMVKKTAMLAA